MYKNFFGFKERPFKLVPDPAYLFLSRSHEEALAHLTYAVIQGDGFVEITGEIGTGKTTLCRTFLERLNDETKAAYIFNPKLNSIQLLKAINDEFGINSEAENTKDLIDGLNTFLIEEKSKGNSVILLIDEAQNLNKEVLEQLRLLSNLETSRHKLVQIILVGQPELGEKLDSRDLRQLAQRITLSCQLIPLSYKELTQYIQHRVHIASQKPGVKFTRSAYRFIYQYSQGIPRLINILCDRALLTAYVLDQSKITGKIVKAAIRELAGRGDLKRHRFWQRKRAVICFSILFLALLIGSFYRSQFRIIADRLTPRESEKVVHFQADHLKPPAVNTPEPEVQSTRMQNAKTEGMKELQPLIETTEVTPSEPVQTEPLKRPQPIRQEPIAITTSLSDINVSYEKNQTHVEEPAESLSNFLGTLDHISSRHFALKIAMDIWDERSNIKPFYDHISDDPSFFRLAAKENGLLIRRVKRNFNTLKKLHLPAILSFYLPNTSTSVYLTLSKINENKIILSGGKDQSKIELESSDLQSYWSGAAYIPWKNFLSIEGAIPLYSPKESIITLKSIMKDIGFNDIEISPFYDEVTRQAVKDIQKKYGLHVDGVVGPTTKIAIYNEKYFSEVPQITNAKR